MVDVLLLRSWPVLIDAGLQSYPTPIRSDTQIGKRTLAARQAYDYINENSAETDIIKSNPAETLSIPVGLYANRQMAVSGHTAFGIPPDEFYARASTVAEIFKATNWIEIDASCKAYSISVLVANDLDPFWHRLPVLAQERKPLYRNDFYAVFRCGNNVQP